ncbi:MAG TPA: SMI1/KNR4 family protein [Pirellulaceae bacterium]|nr:SMI1/KNR4 family protein [Pirellulaceae bacterium]
MNQIDAVYAAFSKQRFPLPSEKEVAALQRRIRTTLPADYVQFLLKYNGGYFNDPVFLAVDPDCPRDHLDVLWGIKASHVSDGLASKRHLALFDDNDPLQLLPIGYTIMGNLLILIVGGDDNGAIVLKRASSDDYFLVANSITEFFDRVSLTNAE